MKTVITMAIVIPSIYLMLGYTDINKKTDRISSPVVKTVPQHIHKPLPTNPPQQDIVVVQVEHQEFPFDIAGNFPYVVMVDNVVWTFKKEDVYEFLLKAKDFPDGPGTGRTRPLSTKK